MKSKEISKIKKQKSILNKKIEELNEKINRLEEKESDLISKEIKIILNAEEIDIYEFLEMFVKDKKKGKNDENKEVS